MAIQAYVKIKGAKQGQFKGEGVQKAGGNGAIPILRFQSAATAPRDTATGQASGKRQWQPIRFTKEWGASSPQLVQALTTNEVLPSVVFEFWRPDKAGKVQLHYRITLQNATVASVDSSVDLIAPGGAEVGHELDEVELAFQSIMIEDVADNVKATDDWHESVSPQPQPMIREPIRPVAPG